VSENDPHRFERLPPTAADRTVEGRATRAAVVDFWTERYGVPPATWADYTFWEKGAGKVWAFADDAPTPLAVEALGMVVLRTRQEHWKPTTNAAQRFGRRATRNVCHLSESAAKRFLAGEDQAVDWDGDWGYLLVTHDLAGRREPVGVGLYLHGELRSVVPKAHRREL
jgi:NOL1/NOP2/fmu family ribosome biogenesis protein